MARETPDDAERYRIFENSQRVSDGDHALTEFKVLRFAEFEKRKLSASI